MSVADPRILDEAARWLARRHASDFSEVEQTALTRWRNQSSQHEHVWQHAQQLQDRMGSVPAAVGMAVLNRSRPKGTRRHVLRAAALAAATPALGWLACQHMPWREWTADYRTAKGEQRTLTLADGSRVLLNTDSAISVRLDREARYISHHAGEILVETSHATEYAALPFIVQTADGRMQALGTRFIVRKHGHGTTLSVLEGAVRVMPADSPAPWVVNAGEQLDFDGRGAGPVMPLAIRPDAWTQGVLHAENLPLRDFLAEIGRYRQGLLGCDAEVADLRVSGSYQLRDTDGILALLENSLPVRVRTRTRYWVTITRR
ncbi:fec operon regulator FecR [Delftia tsuruhatensis]|uniref:FecR domain-containing protein n=1 Tax=Delftia tsuruhatensis TaxID=180282 RepID=UPI001E768523|nr:FecR domain-containing protein [Delftia tsuruhatensis]CAB5703826.1 fec operon regulator FecR [Delftia tsuruhatensis]CAC9684310.1 fec operon regulator FecR [Delftia tsuruhatensis]